MELKDWLTLGMAFSAQVIAGLSLILTLKRDLRDKASKLPIGSLDLPKLDGLGPWRANLTIINRTDVPIIIDRIKTREDNPLQIRGDEFKGGWRTERLDPGPKDFSWIDVDVPLEPGDKFSRILLLGPTQHRRLANAVPTELHIDIRLQDQRGTVQRLCIRRIANP